MAVALPLSNPVMLVVSVMAGVEDALATVPAKPLADTTETVVTVPPPAIVAQLKTPFPTTSLRYEFAAPKSVGQTYARELVMLLPAPIVVVKAEPALASTKEPVATEGVPEVSAPETVSEVPVAAPRTGATKVLLLIVTALVLKTNSSMTEAKSGIVRVVAPTVCEVRATVTS